MTPLDFATNLALRDDPEARALAVGIVARGLSDEDPQDPFRQGWPLDISIAAATEYLGLESTPELIAAAAAIAPTISDEMLNRTATT